MEVLLPKPILKDTLSTNSEAKLQFLQKSMNALILEMSKVCIIMVRSLDAMLSDPDPDCIKIIFGTSLGQTLNSNSLITVDSLANNAYCLCQNASRREKGNLMTGH